MMLVVTVFVAVWHAEVVAHRIGEPFGTLVLALAVTVIEVALIVSVMLATRAFATVMIIPDGVVGLCAQLAKMALSNSIDDPLLAFSSNLPGRFGQPAPNSRVRGASLTNPASASD